GGRPYEGTHPDPGGQNRVPFVGHNVTSGDTPTHRGYLLGGTSCGSALALLACDLLVGHARSGSPPRTPERTSTQGRPAVRRVFVHSCGQPCGCLTMQCPPRAPRPAECG